MLVGTFYRTEKVQGSNTVNVIMHAAINPAGSWGDEDEDVRSVQICALLLKTVPNK